MLLRGFNPRSARILFVSSIVHEISPFDSDTAAFTIELSLIACEDSSDSSYLNFFWGERSLERGGDVESYEEEWDLERLSRDLHILMCPLASQNKMENYYLLVRLWDDRSRDLSLSGMDYLDN